MKITRFAMRARGLRFAAALLFAGLGSNHVEAGDVPARYMGDGGIVRLPTNANATQMWHITAMQKYQLDKKYGFILQIVPAATSLATATAIQSGAADIGNFGWIDIQRLRNQGVNLFGVGPFLQWGADHVVVPADSKAKTIGDLKGKKIGVFSRTNIDWILDQTIAKNKYGLDVEKDFVVHEGAVGLLRGLIESGQLDAAHMYNNLTPAMVAGGKVRVLYQMREIVEQLGLPETPQLMYSTTGEYAAGHPQKVRAFLAAYREGVEILKTKDDVWNEFGKQLEMTAESIQLLKEEMRVDLWQTFRPTTEADIKKVSEFLLKEAGPSVLGFTELKDGFMTRDFQ
jgi:NitT/TauT family transport system substrate-binding protein